MTTTTTASASTSTATAAAAQAAAPTPLEMIDAIKAVKLVQAQKIGAACVADVKTGSVLSLNDLAVETGILAGLDLASETLKASL